MEINRLLDDFIANIKNEYSDLELGYEYIDNEDYYLVWHNNEKLETESDDFMAFVGCLLEKELFSRNIYNVSFSYDSAKAETVLIKRISETLNSNDSNLKMTLNNITKKQPDLTITNSNLYFNISNHDNHDLTIDYKGMAA